MLILIGTGFVAVSCGEKQEPTSKNDLQSLTQSQAPAVDYIESINGVSDLSHGTAKIPRRQDLSVVGWAVDAVNKQVAGRVYIDLDGKLYPAQYGTSRPDVALALKDSVFEKSGYSATLPNPAGDAEHHLTVKIVSSDGSTYYTGRRAVFSIQ